MASESIFTHPWLNTFGLYGIKKAVEQCSDLPGKIGDNAVTVMNIAAVIPVVGMIIGIIRCIAAYQILKQDKPEEADKQMAYGFIARGIADILAVGCLGSVLFMIDVIVSIARACLPEKTIIGVDEIRIS